MMAPLYRIKDWDRHFESSETRKVKEFSKFLPLPNRFDTAGYAALMDHSEGERHYGAWVVLVAIASRCTPRGTLMRGDGRPHTPQSLSAITRFKAKTFEALLSRLTSEDIDWVEVVSDGTPADTSGRQRMPADASGCHPRGEERRGEENRGEENVCAEIHNVDSPQDQTVMVFQCDGAIPTWKLMASRVSELQKLYPSLDILTEAKKAELWLKDNPTRRKTAKGMPQFITGWMGRAQDRGGGARAGPAQKPDLFGGLREFVSNGG